MAQYIEDWLPDIREAGLNTQENVVFNGTLTVASTATFSGVVSGNYRNVVNSTAAGSLTAAQSGSLVLFNSATGFQLKLPSPSIGLNYDFAVVARPTSGTIGISTNSGSVFLYGAILAGVAGTSNTLGTFIGDGSTHTVVSMNGTTTGGSVGTVFRVACTSATQWVVSGQSVGSGLLASPIL